MRKTGKILSIVVICLAAFWVWIQRFGGHLEQDVKNSDHSLHAEVRLNDFAAATDADQITINLYRRYSYFGKNVFDAATYGGNIRITWQGNDHLIVHLQRPKQLVVYRQETKWRGVTITYQNE